ncbi:hypothetical protein MHB43_23385 [Paenibacillus sp. FSL H8-0317]|uniref:hypothetical protein n=1 Tax=Paenibacillus sp. FSL H8-0317 TaxID=2921385 RepID=UPI00324A941C
MDGEANVRAGLLQQEGSNKAPVHVADLPPEPEPPLMPIEEYEAAQAAAAAEAAAVTQASTTNPKDGSLAGAALAITAMIPILGALGGIAAQTAIGVGIAAVATGLIASVPKIGSFKPSALNLLDRFTNGFAELQQQENEAKWTMLGKMLTAAKELTTSTSVTDFFKKLEQQNKEISLAYEQIPSYFREKWAREKIQRDLQKSLEFFKSVEKDDVQHQTFFSPYYQEISWALDRAGIYHNITVEEVKHYDFWLRQDLTLEQMKYLTQLIYNPISDEKFVEMIYDYEMHRDLIENGTMTGGNLRVRTPDIEGKVMQVVGNGFKKAATFVKKKWTDGQKMRIVSGGGSDWSGDKSKKTGQASSGGKTEGEPETKPNQAGSDQKPPKQKPKDTETKTNPEKNATPNEVNSWKKSLPNKVEGNSEADTKPPKPPKPEGEQDTNKPKGNTEGTEGTGKDSVNIPKIDWSKYNRVDNYKPTFETIPDEANHRLASKHYDEIRSVGMEDIEQVAKNTGLSVEEIRAVKQHIFLDSHKIPLSDKSYRVGHFTPDADFGYAWKQAQKEKALTLSQKEWLQQMIKHELTEIKLMKQGYPYKNPNAYNSDSNTFGSDPPGAHDAAEPQPRGEFDGAFSYNLKEQGKIEKQLEREKGE